MPESRIGINITASSRQFARSQTLLVAYTFVIAEAFYLRFTFGLYRHDVPCSIESVVSFNFEEVDSHPVPPNLWDMAILAFKVISIVCLTLKTSQIIQHCKPCDFSSY